MFLNELCLALSMCEGLYIYDCMFVARYFSFVFVFVYEHVRVIVSVFFCICLPKCLLAVLLVFVFRCVCGHSCV